MATCREQHKTMPDRVVKAQALSDMKERTQPSSRQRTTARRGECRLKRLVAGVSGYIFDECVTKCVAVLKQHGGFAPTVPSRRSKAG